MSKIQVFDPNGNQADYTEEELSTEWQAGNIDRNSVYLIEGMEEPEPVADLFSMVEADVLAAPVETPAAATYAYTYTKDPRALTSFVVKMLWIGLGMEVGMILFTLVEFGLLHSTISDEQLSSWYMVYGLFGLAYMLVFLVTAIPFLKWQYRANVNCRGFGAELTYSPGWTVGYYFIPIICWIRPYQVMSQIWRASDNPSDFEAAETPKFLNTWWTLWVISSILGNVSMRLPVDTIDELKVSSVVTLIQASIGIALVLFAIKVIKGIAALQEDLVNGTKV